MRVLAGVASAALVVLFASLAHAGATVVIVNADPPDAGFNDSEAGHAGRRQPRDDARCPAARRVSGGGPDWGQRLDSTVPITVLSHFVPLTCDSNGATLGSAGPTNIFASDDPTLDAGIPPTFFPKEKTWYVSALTAALAGKRLLSGTGTDPTNYDIQARFNSTFDDPNATNCHGFVWYYGLDNQHGNSLDLLTTVLHELGHGLGFLSLTDPTTGGFEQGEQDIWSYFLYDERSGKHWNELDAAGRMASAVSGALSWDGTSVKSAVPSFLAVAPLVRVTSAPQTPAAVKDYLQVAPAQFGATITAGGGVSGPLGVGSTGFGCTGQGRLAPLDGKIAILDCGGPTPDAGCTFVEKARNAQDAGAIPASRRQQHRRAHFARRDRAHVVIPVVMVTQVDGTTLKVAVDAGPVSAAIVLDPDGGSFQGADASKRPFMYAPSTLDLGSSVSHWNTTAFPNLLMEPFINADLTHSLDLTVPALADIGWSTAGGTGGGGTDAGGGPDAGGGGGSTSKSGCTSASGPPTPWLALLALLAFVLRKRPVGRVGASETAGEPPGHPGFRSVGFRPSENQ